MASAKTLEIQFQSDQIDRTLSPSYGEHINNIINNLISILGGQFDDYEEFFQINFNFLFNTQRFCHLRCRS